MSAEKQQLDEERTEQIRAKANMELDVDDARVGDDICSWPTSCDKL